jgi:hypothetical protein
MLLTDPWCSAQCPLWLMLLDLFIMIHAPYLYG